MKKRNKKYVPSPQFNTVLHSKKLDKLDKELEIHGKAIEALSRSHDIHISYLGNFARHDIKNAILSMDSILTTTEAGDFNDEKIGSLSIYLEVIRKTIDNFSKLVPYSTNGAFKLETFFIAVELLSRFDMQNNNIDLKFEYDRTDETEIYLPFQSLIQMINNLIINASKSLEIVEHKRLLLQGCVENDHLIVTISDNGRLIPENEYEKIFEYGYSTTKGSGIGLYHADYLCKQWGGSISLDWELEKEMTKKFSIKVPIFIYGENNLNN